jgi:hypothetical protein
MGAVRRVRHVVAPNSFTVAARVSASSVAGSVAVKPALAASASLTGKWSAAR